MECLSDLHLDGTAIKELPLSVDLLSGLILLNLKDCKNLKSFPSAIINGLKFLKTLNLSGCLSIFPLNSPKAATSCFLQFPMNLMVIRSLDSTALMLPSLSGLSSLTKLNLSDCNLGEGAIPSNICNLLSLKFLNLNKNHFVSLPGTINRLPQLKYLLLENCERLQSLPELPSNILAVKVAGCSSLETLVDALKLCRSNVSVINCVNCFRLLGCNDLAFSILKWFLETESNPRSYFSFVVPGSKIPGWFKYQNEGSSITILRLPDSYYNKKRLVGYAICSVFNVHKHPQKVKSSCSYLKHELICCMKYEKIESSYFYFLRFDEESVADVSDHLWIICLSNQQLCKSHWQFESNLIELSFRPHCDSCQEFQVKRCGVNPIYVDEVEKFNNTTKEWNFDESDQVYILGKWGETNDETSVKGEGKKVNTL